MKLKKALEIVASLAMDNTLGDSEIAGDKELQKEQKRQIDAIDEIYKLIELL